MEQTHSNSDNFLWGCIILTEGKFETLHCSMMKGENRASILRAWCLAVVVDF